MRQEKISIQDVSVIISIVVNIKQLKTQKVCLDIHILYLEDITRMRNLDYKFIILEEVVQY